MNRRSKAARLLGAAIPVIVFALIAAVMLIGIADAGRTGDERELELARESIRRAIITCYAIEGSYPESYEYIRENYGVRVDTEKFSVQYLPQGSNLLPDVVLIPIDGGTK